MMTGGSEGNWIIFVSTTLMYLVIRIFISSTCQNITVYLKFESIYYVTKDHMYCDTRHTPYIIYLADHED